MALITLTNDDGSTIVFHDQAYTDAAVAAVPTTGEVVKDVVVENTDGTTETFEPVEAPAVEATEV